MTSKYEKSQGTNLFISKLPAEDVSATAIDFLALGCTTKETSFTGGQKTDLDTTTLCSKEQETINGLPAAAEISINANFSADDDGQESLRKAYEEDTKHAFKVIFPSGNGFAFLAEVRQHTWSAPTNGIVAATFTLRLKGKTVPIKNGEIVKPAPQSAPIVEGKK
ncbi:phage tail protein [Providencia sp. JGM181]|uniref:phage tail tube protein n=1 Tax=unclassified Providencia TaxID=2633465 RepID=UPI001BA9BFB0|nr:MULTISPECIES: phage tail tube protein [unclassified Providencia]MBS0925368.1 phage tail protein [Providencia sp. JGM181]MBS0932842.1 phage tail protein [Providencia sp. JGM172]MBS0997035.1 phage tail protein [Providencia sp. JGM178]